MISHNEVLQDRIEDLEQLVEELSKKLVARDIELYDQVTKTVSVESRYLELVDAMELHQKEAKQLVRQMECLHRDVVISGLYKIEQGVDILKHDLEEDIK